MKSTPYVLLAAAALIVGASQVQSQSPAPAGRSQQLQSLRDRNVRILEQQAATMLKLGELKKEADQLRIFARRS